MFVPRSPEMGLAWCHDAVQDVSRTFALTVDALEEPMASRVCLGYLLCRVADTVEDAPELPPGTRADLLRTYRAALDPGNNTEMSDFRTAVDPWLPAPADRSEDWAVVAEAPTVWTAFRDQPEPVQRAVLPPVREMVGGMADFVERHAGHGGLRIADRAELERYCHYAAGTVGTLITNLLTTDLPRERARPLYDTAEGFGRFLQLINISKDVYDDYTEENNVYLPATWLAEEGVDPEAVLDPDNRAAAARVVARTADHARSFRDDAQAYLEAMPLVDGNTMAAWSVPFLLGVGTLRELTARPADALTEGGVTVSREEVLAVMTAAEDAGRDALDDLRETIAREPYHLAHS